MRARLHRRGRAIGLFREGTHVLCEERGTGQLLPAASDALDRVNAILGSLAFDAARELDVSENADASQRAVHVELDRHGVDLRPLRTVALPDGVTGLAVGREVVAGSPFVTDAVAAGDATVMLRRHVQAFFQGNRYLLQDLVAHVVAAAGGARTLVDLYAGVGVFAIAAAAGTGARVVAVEGDRFAALDLDANARASGAQVETVHQPVEQFTAATSTRPEAAIVDPPRTGMSRQALDGVIALRPARLVYVSCDVATLARDARRLVDAGWTLARAQGFDLFPNTPHVETVAVFDAGGHL
jgi:23S rRNA (uracil1939-C5)-methyltransferase